MSTLTNTEQPSAAPTLDRRGSILIAAGGLGFFIYGPLHPTGNNQGTKIAQLHSMLVEPTWYPAHLVGILAFGCLAAGILSIAARSDLPESVHRVARRVGVLAVVMVVGQVIHTLAGTQAHAIADGSTTPLVRLFMGVETLVNPIWALGIVALAVWGGLTRSVGNRVVMMFGIVGGLAFALANATIAFIDTFDSLFPVAGLLGVWAVAVGVIGLFRR